MAAHQSPMISIPKKTTDEVDWTTPIRSLIAQSYGDNPDNYAAECASLQRCRQDAVRGAGSDTTARDLLYKYFGQLELLELRFSEIRVNFTWRDAFTNKPTTQTSIAYEKASILFQIAATHSAIASSQSRSDPEGLKRAFYYFRTCTGMLTYINDNFLHAPSTDLSREVVRFLINIILAQATEVFFEKCTDEKKANALISKIASQAGSLYTTLTEDVKEFMGKGIFDRNWVTLLQIKAKYFSSLTQYYRGLADSASGKHGEALARFMQAESLSKEAYRSAQSFSASFVTNLSPNLPADAGYTIQEKTKAHQAICTDKKAETQRENDLIYNAVCPAFETLSVVEKAIVATPISIQEVYGNSEVQKTIGQDFFIRLVPLSVHEKASVYSEEKAKLVRAEAEKVEQAEGEARSAVDGLGVKEGLIRYKAMAEGEVSGGEEVPLEVRRWKEDIAVTEEQEGVDTLIQQLNKLKTDVHRELDDISRDLELESKECEVLRVKYEHLWPQAPSATLTKSQRQDLKSHVGALEAAGVSDQQVMKLWDSVRSDIQLLLSPQVEQLFSERGGSKPENLLDLDVGSEVDDATERSKIKGSVTEIEDRLNRLRMISKERGEVLRDLKEKIQGDDVSHLLLLNRRNSGVEPALFATELEKFRPYQQRLTSTVHHQEVALRELETLWAGLKTLAGRGPGARKWEEREKRKKETIKRFSKARDVYMEVRDGLAKGFQFYGDLTDLTSKLRGDVRTYVTERTNEREALIAKLETEKRLSAATISPPPLAAKPVPSHSTQSRTSIDSVFSNLNLNDQSQSQPPKPFQQTPSWLQASSPPSSSSQQYGGSPPTANTPTQHSFSSSLPPPPPPPSQQHAHYQYMPIGIGSHASSPPPPPPPPQQRPLQNPSFLPPPPSKPPTQSPYPPPSSSPLDPYASLAMFIPSTMSPPVPSPPSAPSAPPIQQGGYSAYYGQTQPPQPQQQNSFGILPPPPPPPPPTSQQYDAYPPQQHYGGFPPPPHGNSYGYSRGY